MLPLLLFTVNILLSAIDVSIIGLFSNRLIDLLSTVQLILLEGMENSTAQPLKKNPLIKFLRNYAHTCLFVSSIYHFLSCYYYYTRA